MPLSGAVCGVGAGTAWVRDGRGAGVRIVGACVADCEGRPVGAMVGDVVGDGPGAASCPITRGPTGTMPLSSTGPCT